MNSPLELRPSMLKRIFPDQIGNRYCGHRLGLWLLGLIVVLKLIMGINSIVNTAEVASGADGFPLELYGASGASAVLMLFAIIGVGQVTLGLVGAVALVRYRAMVPLVYLILIFEYAARRLVVSAHAIDRAPASQVGFYINMALVALLVVGFVLSLWPRTRAAPARSLP